MAKPEIQPVGRISRRRNPRPFGDRMADYAPLIHPTRSLDHIVENDRLDWIDHWFDELLKTGFSLDQVMSLLAKWLSSRKTIAAFRIACTVLIHAGRRTDLQILDVNIEPNEEVAAMRLDTEFAVRRRSLH